MTATSNSSYEDIKLKWSNFSLWVDLDSFLIVHNTLNKATVKISARLKRLIDYYLEGKNSYQYIPSEIQICIERLRRERILVPRYIDEKMELLTFFKKLMEKTFEVVLLPTTACQLNCPYCYEDGIADKNMSLEIAKNIILWCKNYITKNKFFKEFRLVLYGGEPLLNWKVIKFILPRLYNLCHKNNVSFKLEIITNGELLDQDKFSFLNKYNLKKIQITLDGPREVHDTRRRRKDGKGTFDAIIKNILNIFSLTNNVKMKLRINFDKQNVESIPKLLDFLAKYKFQDKVELSFGFIGPSTCELLGQNVQDSYFKKFGFNRDEGISKFCWLWREAKNRGFKVPLEYPSIVLCTAKKTHSVVVQPDGTLTKCICLVGHDKFVVGDIFSTDKISTFPYLAFEKSIEQCFSKKCPFIPICAGGCPYDIITSSKESCKECLNRINRELLLLNFSF